MPFQELYWHEKVVVRKVTFIESGDKEFSKPISNFQENPFITKIMERYRKGKGPATGEDEDTKEAARRHAQQILDENRRLADGEGKETSVPGTRFARGN